MNRTRRCPHDLLLIALLAQLLCFHPSAAQTILPQAPAPALEIPPQASYLSHAGVLCAVGAATSSAATKPTVGCGAGLSLFEVPLFVEVGVMGPQANRSPVSGYISLDWHVPLVSLRFRVQPQVLFGYSRLFETGHAADFGLALAMPRPSHHDGSSLRVELRDYATFSNPTQHLVVLRLGLMTPVHD